jgi:hypothetical protein
MNDLPVFFLNRVFGFIIFNNVIINALGVISVCKKSVLVQLLEQVTSLSN